MTKSELDLLHDVSMKTMLDDDERNALRQSLISYMDKTPIRGSSSRRIASKRPFFSFSVISFSIIALIIIATASVSLVAQASVPGESLYFIKRSVNENIKGFFALTEKSKISHHVELASQRLEEAEKLNARSQLSAAAKATIVKDFSAHVKEASVHVEKLVRRQDYAGATEAMNQLEASINAHASILPDLSLVGTSSVD